MNFEFSPDQLQFKDEARKLLSDQCPSSAVRKLLDEGAPMHRALWATLGELGFLGAAIPQAYGGTGAGYLELCVLAEELGRAIAPIPFSSSICLGAELILAAASEDQKLKYLPRLASGASIACVALSEGLGRIAPNAVTTTARGDRLTGVKWPVQDGDVADLAIVPARSGDTISLYLVELNAPGVTRKVLQSIDPTRSQARIEFSDTPAQLLTADAWPALVTALDRAAVLTAFEQVGGAQRAIEMGREYALERYAFGRPIGSFQAIKHKLVDMYVSTVLARSNCYYGAWAMANDARQLPEAAASARVSASQAFFQCAKENIQIHGGMGFTWDLDCHLYYRRANLLAVNLGGVTQWSDRLVEQLRDRRTEQEGASHGL